MEFPAFRVERRSNQNVQILEPTGRITIGPGSRGIRQAFDDVAEGGFRRVLLNMSNVSYVDSAGLGTIVTGLSLFKKNGGTMVLSNVQQRVAQLLELTNLTGVLKMYPTEDAALRGLEEETEQIVS